MIIKTDEKEIKIRNGIVVEVGKNLEDDEVFDFQNAKIISGLVDMHCHLREPGFEDKETIETGALSAIAGGFVAICPMANTKPVNDNEKILKFILEKAKNTGVNVFPICAVSKGLCSDVLSDFRLLKSKGAIAFSNDGLPILNRELFEKALKTKELIISHLENEYEEAKFQIDILKKVKGAKLHFAHISTKKAIDLIRKAKNDGLNVSCETAPHYFTFSKENLNFENGIYKMNPPIATFEDKIAVEEAIRDGTVDIVATDHAPHLKSEKLLKYSESANGIVGFETCVGAFCEKFSVELLEEKIAKNPAKRLGLNNFNEIKPGSEANLTVVKENFGYRIEEEKFESKCKISPFNGFIFHTKAIASVVKGKLNIIKGGENV